MRRTTLSGVMLGLFLFCVSGIVLASEVDELCERAKVLRKKSAISAEQGNREQAELLERESAELMEAAERMEQKARDRGETWDRSGIDKEVQHLKGRLENLLFKERKMREANAPEHDLAKVHGDIVATERELKQIHARRAEPGEHRLEFREQAEKLEIASRRIQHMRAAAQNLKMAEAHDLAHQVMEKADALERELQEGKQRLAAEMQKHHDGDDGMEIVRDLRAEVERLRAEVKELSLKIEKR
jgi:hypothetical protein